jgi:hypothetical protein
VSILAWAALGLLSRPMSAHVVPMTGEKMVRASEHIVVGQVEDRRVHWNPQHTLILTSYTLAVEESLQGEPPERIKISVPGGTLDGETHGTCVEIRLEVGSRYLLFLEDPERPSITPVVGAWQGVFRETQEKEFRELVGLVRDLIAHVRTLPSPRPETKRQASLPPQELPAKTYDPSPGRPVWESRVPARLPEAGLPPLPWAERPLSGAKESLSGPSDVENKYYYQYTALAPILINQLPPDSPFSPHDQHQMSSWNLYGKNLFRVYPEPTGQWAFGNNVFDIAGFPDNAALAEQLDRWWGGEALGLTAVRVRNGRIIEADIALNPAHRWTLQEADETETGGDGESFAQTMLHELGHVWGLIHPFASQDVNWDSVMNYAPREYRLRKLFADDVAGARKFYPGIKLRDGLISSYITQDAPGMEAAYVPVRPASSAVTAGSALRLTGSLKIENVGTANLARPSVEIYLVPARFSLAGAIHLGTLRAKSTVKPLKTLNINLDPVTSLRIPRNAPQGNYYLAFFLRDPKDKHQANNSAWSNSNVTVSVH